MSIQHNLLGSLVGLPSLDEESDILASRVWKSSQQGKRLLIMTTTALSLFNFNTHQIRVVSIDGSPWFVARDIILSLGIELGVKGAKHRLGYLQEDEQQFVLKSNIHQMGGSFPNRGAWVISESGLYKIALRSNARDAFPVQDWVTREVLPAIRKDGMYVMGEEKVKTGEMSEDEMVLLVMTRLQQKVGRLAEEKAQLAAENAVLERKANFITVDVFRGLRGEYWPRPKPLQMGKAATWISSQPFSSKGPGNPKTPLSYIN